MRSVDLLRRAEGIFDDSGIESARLEAEILLAHVLKVSRLYLYVNPEYLLTQEQVDSYNELIERRLKHEPTAYILGRREFMDLNLIVNEDVLIPRPETEILVETVIDQLNDIRSITKIADIGTGSGAIAISLAKHLPYTSIEAVDISEKALHVAKLNANKYNLGSRIIFHLGDLISPLEGKFKAIVSNPPYIPSKVIDTLQSEIKEYEPKISLDGGADGLDFYRRLIADSPNLLTEDGFLAMEIGADQAEPVTDLAQSGHFREVEIIKDLSHDDRVIICRLN